MCNCMASLNYFSATLKTGIYSSPSEMNMWNSVLLTRIRLINEICDYSFIVIFSVLLGACQSINSIMESNQYDIL